MHCSSSCCSRGHVQSCQLQSHRRIQCLCFGTPFVYAPPDLTSITPLFGLITGGDLVHITGTFLNGAMTCRFGKNRTPVLSTSLTEVTCATPPADVASSVVVELGYGSSGSSASAEEQGNVFLTAQPSPQSLLLKGTS